MKISKVLFLAVIGLFTLNSCGDDDSGQSAIDIITSGIWKVTESRSDIDGDGDLDDTLENCSRDDEYVFEEDGTLNFDEGATKCDAADPQSDTGNWGLSPDEQTLTLTVGGFGIPFTVVSLSSNRMELRGENFGDVTETVFEK